jgi:hypothetical protein
LGATAITRRWGLSSVSPEHRATKELVEVIRVDIAIIVEITRLGRTCPDEEIGKIDASITVIIWSSTRRWGLGATAVTRRWRLGATAVTRR